MQYSLLAAAAFLAGIASAQNPFSFTTLSTITAGKPFNITWSPSTGTTDTVTLVLRQGDPSHLTTITTIACLLPFPLHSPISLLPPFLPPFLLSPLLYSLVRTSMVMRKIRSVRILYWHIWRNSKHPKHRLLPLDTLHLPRPRHRLRLRDHRRWKYKHCELLWSIHHWLHQHYILCRTIFYHFCIYWLFYNLCYCFYDEYWKLELQDGINHGINHELHRDKLDDEFKYDEDER